MNDIDPGNILVHEGTRYVIDTITNDGVIEVSELGDRHLSECPVEYGDECIDPECDGRVGETLRDPETYSAHELYCFGCGLNWAEHGGTWEEKYADWPTSFSFEETTPPERDDDSEVPA